MDELTVVLRARALVSRVNANSFPVQVEEYVKAMGYILRIDYNLSAEEPGYSTPNAGAKRYIVVNGNHLSERQRFTVCHEVAHIELDLPSEHGSTALWSYRKRPMNEIYCDIFAAELLLPFYLFKPLADKAEICFAEIGNLAGDFEASVTATASRFAAVADAPCAFVLSEAGTIRYASISKVLREKGARISPRIALPSSSASAAVRCGRMVNTPQEIAADMWFSDWPRDGVLLEEARHLTPWDQTLTLLWFEDGEVYDEPGVQEELEGELGLEELDGILPWPGKKRRRP